MTNSNCCSGGNHNRICSVRARNPSGPTQKWNFITTRKLGYIASTRHEQNRYNRRLRFRCLNENRLHSIAARAPEAETMESHSKQNIRKNLICIPLHYLWQFTSFTGTNWGMMGTWNWHPCRWEIVLNLPASALLLMMIGASTRWRQNPESGDWSIHMLIGPISSYLALSFTSYRWALFVGSQRKRHPEKKPCEPFDYCATQLCSNIWFAEFVLIFRGIVFSVSARGTEERSGEMTAAIERKGRCRSSLPNAKRGIDVEQIRLGDESLICSASERFRERSFKMMLWFDGVVESGGTAWF